MDLIKRFWNRNETRIAQAIIFLAMIIFVLMILIAAGLMEKISEIH